MIGKIKGYKVIITMPETMSKERRDMIKAYGAEIILTEGSKGMKGAIEEAERLASTKGYFMPQQFLNEANAKKHYETTAEEIIKRYSRFRCIYCRGRNWRNYYRSRKKIKGI